MNAKLDALSAHDVLKLNDLGGYTVPTRGLYPFQWNWDAAITALGWLAAGDEARAWREVERLLEGQWDNGMVPHIVFHGDAETYFPGPEVWGVKHSPSTSAISQPPVLASVMKLLFEEGRDRRLAEEKLAATLPGVIRYHLWFYRDRDPEHTGRVCSYHPWESGMDNSPQWDGPLAGVPPVDAEYVRRDTGLVDPSERPHKYEYDRYIYLVKFFQQNEHDAEVLYRDCPYRVEDISLISILHRGTRDLIALCEEDAAGLGLVNTHGEALFSLKQSLARTEEGVQALWSDELGCFLSRDARANVLLEHVTTAGILPLFAGVASGAQAQRMGGLLEEWLEQAPFGVASTHPESTRFEPKRYWRGPSWLHINWMLAIGCEEYGMSRDADQIKQASQKCIEAAGYYEYFNSVTGEGCGGRDFSWTAAMDLYWLNPLESFTASKAAAGVVEAS
ncbi:MGH1-like glycoside hydrolase domain-containing protein [Cobetia amphilecti]|uniref:MGH1-like glycoside hydrolase domain-containing protein n=1 Tax=Cobetia amphilecti TaxID=1055104 RepID=UPI0032977BAB